MEMKTDFVKITWLVTEDGARFRPTFTGSPAKLERTPGPSRRGRHRDLKGALTAGSPSTPTRFQGLCPRLPPDSSNQPSGLFWQATSDNSADSTVGEVGG